MKAGVITTATFDRTFYERGFALLQCEEIEFGVFLAFCENLKFKGPGP